MTLTPDVINAFFEFFGGLLLFLNVRRLYLDKRLNGVSLVPSLFYTAWGYWNVFYYRELGQPVSLVAGILPAASNTAWVAMALYYQYRARPCGLKRYGDVVVTLNGVELHPIECTFKESGS